MGRIFFTLPIPFIHVKQKESAMNTQTALKKLNIDFANKTPAAIFRRNKVWTQRLRHLSQLGFATFILYNSVQHNLATVDGAVPSIDALCPFGGVETLWRVISSGGQYVPKTHASNLVLLIGLVVGTLIAGGAFCGWVCPFGALQDLLTGIRKRLHLPEIVVPEKLDGVLRYGRYVTLAVILFQTITTITLWFAEIDPYRTLFGLEWLFNFDWAASAGAYLISFGVLFATLFVERGFCRYACPLGGAISVLGRFSLFRIRRTASSCKGCAICDVPCPVKLRISDVDVVSSNCIGCMACVNACPRHSTLDMQLKPTWLDFLKRPAASTQKAN
ncbi:MAG TPA: 4Fe-4S binding protein [Thermoflexales bacterium]|nr:4Fe-4S binding protein [Thermoflexales bacterium]HQW34553.1 4Fe-4S binding protein [Thermoflexales bacterium]HQZ21990.1 4Fe-4S binding protein [Thermoflexales bacterium]